MKLIIENEILKNQDTPVLAESINIYDIEFEFSEEWNNLSKKIVYVKDDNIYEEAIIENKSTIPNLPNGIYAIGVVGLAVNGETVVKRKATNLLAKAIMNSGAEYTVNTYTEQSVTTFERYLQEITELSEQIHSDNEEIAENVIEARELHQETKDYRDTALQYVSAITFSTFEVDLEDGKLYINNDEKLGNAGFSINENGELEVEYNG